LFFLKKSLAKLKIRAQPCASSEEAQGFLEFKR